MQIHCLHNIIGIFAHRSVHLVDILQHDLFEFLERQVSFLESEVDVFVEGRLVGRIVEVGQVGVGEGLVDSDSAVRVELEALVDQIQDLRVRVVDSLGGLLPGVLRHPQDELPRVFVLHEGQLVFGRLAEGFYEELDELLVVASLEQRLARDQLVDRAAHRPDIYGLGYPWLPCDSSAN